MAFVFHLTWMITITCTIPTLAKLSHVTIELNPFLSYFIVNCLLHFDCLLTHLTYTSSYLVAIMYFVSLPLLYISWVLNLPSYHSWRTTFGLNPFLWALHEQTKTKKKKRRSIKWRRCRGMVNGSVWTLVICRVIANLDTWFFLSFVLLCFHLTLWATTFSCKTLVSFLL